MENTINTIPVVRLVRCPKCPTVLTERVEIPIYKCGGCGAILQAKARSSSGQNLSSVSNIPSSQNLPESDSLSSGSKSLSGAVENPEINNLSVSDSISDNICMEKSLGQDQNEIKNLNVSDFNGETHESYSIRERLEESSDDLEKSLNVSPEVYDSQKSNDKLEKSSELPWLSATSEKNVLNMEFGNGSHFSLTSTSSSRAYDGSVSSTDEDNKNRVFHLSRRTFRNKNMTNSTISTNAGENSITSSNDSLHSAGSGELSSDHDARSIEQDSFFTSQAIQQNRIESKNKGSSSSPAKEVKIQINQRGSEQDNHMKILSRFDELRNELTGLFNETTNSKESSPLGVKISQFQRKIPSKEYRSSLIPFSRPLSSSHSHDYSGDKCCHNEHCRPCPHNVCCHLSEPPIPPLHFQTKIINQEPQNLRFKVSKPQNIIRLCRPVSGGSPFVICYKCFKLLQLPADFLVSPKRVNKLRCGGCAQVLMYFFRPRAPSITETLAEDRHPPSEEDGQLGVVVAADENSAFRHEDITAWDPISSSESNSGELEPSLHKSRSFDERLEEEQQGEDGCFRGSRLHNLMGYSSANDLLLRNGYSHDGYQSAVSSNPRPFSGSKRWERR